MSGRRCRALRAAFKKAHGRPPNKTRYFRDGTYEPSEWRRIKRGGDVLQVGGWGAVPRYRLERAREVSR